jgi:regulator of nucleoside diphosphate kinase
MKPKLSDADLRAINHAAQSRSCESELITDILQRSEVVPEINLPEKTVRLNSIVLFWHSLLKKVVKLRIVLPSKADLQTRNISVFSPIRLALLGRSENDSIHVTIGGLKKELKIIKVSNK